MEVKKEHSEMVAVKQEKVEEEETLPKGWKRHGEGLVSPQGKKFASMVAAVEWMIQNKATSDQIYQVGEGCLMKFLFIISQIWMGLGREGWGLGTSTTSLLPGGWRIKWVEEVGGEHCYILILFLNKKPGWRLALPLAAVPGAPRHKQSQG